MAIPSVAVAGQITAGLMNQLIVGVNSQALTGVVPTSVAGTGVTVSTNGAVTFTAATTVSVNGVFTGTYANYRLVWNISTRSAGNALFLRLRQAGTDLSSATYAYTRGYDSGTTRTVLSATAASSASIDNGIAAGQTSDGYMDVFGPANGVYTAGAGTSVSVSGSTIQTLTTGWQNSSTTPSDGFTFLLGGGGTITGTVRIYGYNNLT